MLRTSRIRLLLTRIVLSSIVSLVFLSYNPINAPCYHIYIYDLLNSVKNCNNLLPVLSGIGTNVRFHVATLR